MKIIEIIPTLGTGGGEKFAIDLSNSFADAGHDCSIVTMYSPSKRDSLRHCVQDNVRTDTLNKRPGADFGCMFRLTRFIKKNSPDIVHAHLSAITYLLIAALVCRKTKFYATIHSEARREAGTKLSKWIRLFLFKCKLVTPITISNKSEQSYKDFYGHNAKIIPNGTMLPVVKEEISSYYTKYKTGVDHLFVHVASIQPVKNQILLINAFERLLSTGVNARLILIGRVGKYGKDIYEQIKPHFSDKIIHLGEHGDICSILSACDAFCLSSKMEGMPITIIEALSVGCIPIVTPVGGCTDLINDGVNGFIADDTSTEGYLNAMKRYIDTDYSKKQEMRQAAIRLYKQNYSIDIVRDRHIEFFNH